MNETHQITAKSLPFQNPAKHNAMNSMRRAFQINSGSAQLFSFATPSVGLWHLPNSHTASLIPLIFTAQKQKCLSDVQLWGGWVCGLWEARPRACFSTHPIIDACRETHTYTVSHNIWCKTGWIGSTYHEKVVDLYLTPPYEMKGISYCLLTL